MGELRFTFFRAHRKWGKERGKERGSGLVGVAVAGEGDDVGKGC